MEKMQDVITVIDSDAHARDSEEMIKPYLPEPFRSRKEPPSQRRFFDRHLGGTLGHSGAKHEERLAAMDTQEIHTAVLYPTLGLVIGQVQEPAYAAALCRAYNDFIADYCKVSPRLKAVANLPIFNPEEAVKELKRAVTELEFVEECWQGRATAGI